MIPYGKQLIDEDDIASVVDVLRSDWLTTGPAVEAFEQAFATFCGVKYAVAVNSGTAALHAAMFAAEVGPGDEVLVTPMSFAASANCIVFQGGLPIFVDVRDDDLLIDPIKIEDALKRNGKKVKGIVAVDYAGMPSDYDALQAIAEKYGVFLVADACHSVGGAYKGHPVGSLADMSCFSFHPVKNMTTGEGGMVTTDNEALASRMRRFRSHGVTVDFKQRMESGSWLYEMTDLGYNYRITDIQCALGLSQLRKLPDWVQRRNDIAAMYDEAFAEMPDIRSVHPLSLTPAPTVHGRHLYPVRVPAERRTAIFTALREAGIGVNVHYIPIHLHPYYRTQYGMGPGDCPVAEQAYEELLSLPMYPGLTDRELSDVIATIKSKI